MRDAELKFYIRVFISKYYLNDYRYESKKLALLYKNKKP